MTEFDSAADHDVQTRARLVMYHKQSTSGRTRFLRFAADGACAFGGLPETVRIATRADRATTDTVQPHPAHLVRLAEQAFGLPRGALELESEFSEQAVAEDSCLWIYLARFTAIDPPFAAVSAMDGRFVDLMSARDLPAPQLELLRRAYCFVMEG